ncbi:MAG: recombinase family protein [Burkholderiaceae bacterium]|nr:recombinase family protein [Burkholderiaceae bacterium]
MALAYSYIRFSSAKQELGDSLRRQLKLAEDYAAREGLTLDTHSYRDLGVSAFKGKNSTEGRLGTFIRAVETGHIAVGSHLLVESFDRISRDEVDVALELFLKIIRLGVTLVTLQDGKVYSKTALKKDPITNLLGSIMYMLRAHEESQTKSTRVGEAWEQKRSDAANGTKMTAMAPSWLKLSDDRKNWIVDQRKSNVVERIFELALTGYGSPTIARKLNAEAVPTMVRAACWTFGVVNAILKNESVIGNYTPKKVAEEKQAQPIKGYYPAIISETKFYQVREFLTERKWVGGHNNHNVRNLFAGMSYCYECGDRMRLKSTTASKAYIQCQSAYAGGGCKQPIFPYYAAERALMSDFADEIAERIIQSQQADPTDPHLVLNSRRAKLEKRIETLMDALEELDSPQMRSRIAARQAEVAEIDIELRQVVSPLVKSASTREAVALLKRLRELTSLTAEERLQAQTMFKRILTAVHFDATDNTVTLQWENYDWTKDVSLYMDKVGGDRRKAAA